MSRIKINQRGTHTSVIEGARNVLKILKNCQATISPGVIEANVKARGKSVKLKKINNETFEMVIVVNSSKQTFKVYGVNQKDIDQGIAALKSENWNVQTTMDISGAQKI